jgi:hypothetical protein
MTRGLAVAEAAHAPGHDFADPPMSTASQTLTAAPSRLTSPGAARRVALTAANVTPLLVVLVLCLMIVALAAHGPSFLTPTAWRHHYPSWMAGPLSGLWPWHVPPFRTLKWLFTATFGAMFVAYALAAWTSRRLHAGWVIAVLVALQVILFLAPPLQYTDIFNYINYARMGVVHHLNPYTTLPLHEPHRDPTYILSNWHYLRTPYGPLFTLLGYAIVPLGAVASFWVFKALLALSSLGLMALVWWGARLLGRAPGPAIALVGLNPIVLVWGTGADHYDVIMMLLVLGGLLLPLTPHRLGRETLSRHVALARWPALGAALGGVLVIAGLGVKASAAVFIPPAIAIAGRHRRAMVISMAGAALVVGAVALVVFGPHLGGVPAQTTLVSPQGIPNLIGFVLGLGGATPLLRNVLSGVAAIAVVAASARMWRRQDHAMECLCVCAFALILTLGWSAPWYVLWALPFAALCLKDRWRVAVLVYTAYALIASSPIIGNIERGLHFNPRATPIGRAEARHFSDLAAR